VIIEHHLFLWGRITTTYQVQKCLAWHGMYWDYKSSIHASNARWDKSSDCLISLSFCGRYPSFLHT
jgi:hypothetical protein